MSISRRRCEPVRRLHMGLQPAWKDAPRMQQLSQDTRPGKEAGFSGHSWSFTMLAGMVLNF
ncbi:hypothetical protein AAY473_014003 [Plecturocebus cupreus]